MRLLPVFLPAATLPAGAAAQPAPLDYFMHAYGPAARPTLMLDWVFTGIVSAVCIIIALLLLVAILRRRPRASPDAIGRENEGMPWIVIGTGLSICVLFAMVIYALIVLAQSATPPAAPALTITVTGYDWWWKADYGSFQTANEIHIPVGVPVLVKLQSADVIHAFWVPQLAGKTETIPGLTNRQWLQADQPGVYRGQCTQFCGLQHANMAFEVVAQSPADFIAWEKNEHLPTAAVGGDAAAGQQIFLKSCGGCHAVRGTDAMGNHAPDLTHLLSRRTIGAGTMTNTPEHRMQWVEHVQEIKPGALMPDTPLDAEQEKNLSAYLATLK